MKVLKTLIVTATLTSIVPSFAAIACGPQMNTCPTKPEPVIRPTSIPSVPPTEKKNLK